ncbi:hypothetical protein [Salmonella enterica]
MFTGQRVSKTHPLFRAK